MAVIYYVKDGPRPQNSDLGREVPLPVIESRVQGQRVQYLGVTPPELNKGNPSAYYRHVVVEVESSESLGLIFNQVGFFLLLDLLPDHAQQMLFHGQSPPYRAL